MDNAAGDGSLTLWTDPVLMRVRRARQEHVEAAATAAGEAMYELAIHARGLAQRGIMLSGSDPFVSAWCDALIDLHHAVRHYDDGDAWPHDGRQIAWDRIELDHGADIAALVLALLDRLRRDLERCSHFAHERAAAGANRGAA